MSSSGVNQVGGKATSLGAVWTRAVISLSVYLLVWALLVGTLPLSLGGLALVDLLRGDRRLPLPRLVLFMLIYLSCELGGAAIALTLPVLGGRAKDEQGWSPFLERCFRLQLAWGYAIQRATFFIYGMRLVVESDYDFEAKRPLLLLMRHTSLADTILAVVCVSRVYGTRLRYILKKELLWDPCLNLVGRQLPNYFVDRANTNPLREVKAVGRLASNLHQGDGVLIYPEGTRFTRKKQAKLRAKFRGKGNKDLLKWAEGYENVLPPRLAGTLRMMREAPDADIVLGGHTGFEAAATFGSLWRGGLIGKTVRLRFWAVPRSSFPDTPIERRTWIFERWAEMDQFVGQSLGSEQDGE